MDINLLNNKNFEDSSRDEAEEYLENLERSLRILFNSHPKEHGKFTIADHVIKCKRRTTMNLFTLILSNVSKEIKKEVLDSYLAGEVSSLRIKRDSSYNSECYNKYYWVMDKYEDQMSYSFAELRAKFEDD